MTNAEMRTLRRVFGTGKTETQRNYKEAKKIAKVIFEKNGTFTREDHLSLLDMGFNGTDIQNAFNFYRYR